MSDAKGLLEAGGVLPPGTGGAGEDAVPLTARTYRHPGLDDRVVVRLTPAELGGAEDLVAGLLGLEPAEEPEVVGVGRRVRPGFPEWVLAHHPDDGHHALAVVPELERITRRVKTRPKAALDAYLTLAGRLASSVPHLLPTFFERAARGYLAAENTVYAAQMFTRARGAEAEHGLPIDEERHDAVFLEFALAGALQAKTLSAYAAGIAVRVSADEALRRFTRLCVRRTAGGMPPSVQTATDLRRLAKAAGENVRTVEQEYLAEMLALPAVVRAVAGWWKTHRTGLIALGRARPEIRGRLLDLMPKDDDETLPALWLEILEESGAVVALCDPQNAPEEARPEDGTAGWLKRFRSFWAKRRRHVPAPALYPLVERMADRLKTELAAPGEGFPAPEQVDLLDLLLALGVPVADPVRHSMDLEAWARGEKPRDLLALAADSRFRSSFHRSAGSLSGGPGMNAFQKLIDSPGGRPMLAEWVAKTAREAITPGLLALPGGLELLERLPGQVLALAEDEVRAAAGTDLAPILARTLRAGILDELGWPAWEEALAELGCKRHHEALIADAWPYLIVAGRTQARVIGAEGTVLVHDLRVPAGDLAGVPGFRYVDGELLVHWWSSSQGVRLGYWHGSADRVFPMTGHLDDAVSMAWFDDQLRHSLALPGGGRTTGAGLLHRGDTALPSSRRIAFDGTSYWTELSQDGQKSEWREYDPRSGEIGRPGLPSFLSDATRGLPEGSTYIDGVLLPAPSEGPGPTGVPVDGLLGWRIVRLPDGSYRGEDLAGNAITTSRGVLPSHLLFMPGDDRPRALTLNHRQIDMIDPQGVVISHVKTDQRPGPFVQSEVIMPPLPYWHGMRPRDPQGSRALRRVGRETAAALIEAATADGLTTERLLESVRALVPGLTHEDMVAGVAGIARLGVLRQRSLNAITRKLRGVLDPRPEAEAFPGPSDEAVRRAVSGYDGGGRSGTESNTLFTLFGLMRRAMAGRFPARPSELHLSGIPLPYIGLSVYELLLSQASLSHRAVSVFTSPEDREVLGTLLKEFSALGMTGDGRTRTRWRRFRLRLDQEAATEEEWRRGERRALLPLEDGAFLVFLNYSDRDSGVEFPVVFHDPAGRFEVPARYEVLSFGPLIEPEAAFSPDTVLTEAAGRGPAPWFPGAAAEFARLTGTAETTARLVVAGLPKINSWERNFLPPKVRTELGVKVAEAAIAREELRALTDTVKNALVGALVPAEPFRLWTEGPDAAAAAEVWIARVGRSAVVPEALVAEAAEAVRVGRPVRESLPALFDPASDPGLGRDLRWVVRGSEAVPEDEEAPGFASGHLVDAVATMSWLAHRLPAGDPLRERLPAALEAVRARLANPDLMLSLRRRALLPNFRRIAGAPSEVTPTYERFGAVIMPTADDRPMPAVRPSLLDEAGEDAFLPVLREDPATPADVEVALRLARDGRFAALLADPGDPVAGERAADGTWCPQDPSRSVPDLVTEAAERYGLSEDAAAVHLMLLAMPDPTDRDTARWTGWKPARLKAARAELAVTDLVVEARRPRAGRSLFLPGGWAALSAPHLPQEEWKLPLYDLVGGTGAKALIGVLVPVEPSADLYRRAWRRVLEGDVPRFADLEVRRGRRR